MGLLELAARCEAAEGPSRELDALIHNAARTGQPKKYHTPGYTAKNAKLYTASLDAAMTLVPEGWDWTVDFIGERGSATIWLATGTLVASGFTPALALCAAALRARAAEGNEAA